MDMQEREMISESGNRSTCILISKLVVCKFMQFMIGRESRCEKEADA